jgi:hypothetical protein
MHKRLAVFTSILAALAGLATTVTTLLESHLDVKEVAEHRYGFALVVTSLAISLIIPSFLLASQGTDSPISRGRRLRMSLGSGFRL